MPASEPLKSLLASRDAVICECVGRRQKLASDTYKSTVETSFIYLYYFFNCDINLLHQLLEEGARTSSTLASFLASREEVLVTLTRSQTPKMSTSIPQHPLDPLTANEILKVSALLKAHSPEQSLHFKIITIIEPPKAQLRPFLIAERYGAIKENLPRKASSLYYYRGTADLFLAEVNLDSNSVESVKKLDPQFHGQNDMDESNDLRIACLQHPKVLEEIKKLKLPEHLEVVCDPWPYGRDSEKHLPRYVQVSSLSTRCMNNCLLGEVLSVCTRPTPGFKPL
jgi:Cu2+-containing amine oxidase